MLFFYVKYVIYHTTKKISRKCCVTKNPPNEYFPDYVYKLIRDNRYFKIMLFNEPDDCGYCSILPDYDPSSYILCEIIEEYPNGKPKYEMYFGFDYQEKTFLELFDITYHNSVGIVREYSDNFISPLETQLKGTVIL